MEGVLNKRRDHRGGEDTMLSRQEREPRQRNGDAFPNPSGEKAMSKGCAKYSLDLSAYFDGELEGEALTRLQEHLDECEACQAALDKFRRIREAMTQLARRPGGSKSILDAVRARLEEEGPRRRAKKPLVS